MLRRRASMGMGLLGAALAASVGGCTSDAASLFVLCDATPQAENGACTVSADATSCIPYGTWNLRWGQPYVINLVLQNGLSSRAADVPLRAETNAIHVTEFVVTLRNPAGKKIKFTGYPNPYTLRVAGTVLPESEGVVSTQLIPTIYVKQLSEALRSTERPLRQVVADVEIHARTVGEEPVVITPWLWPINLYDRDIEWLSNACFRPEEDTCYEGQDNAAFACFCPDPMDKSCPEE